MDMNRTWLPVLYTVIHDLTLLAQRALQHQQLHPKPILSESEHPQNPLEDATRLIHRAFTLCLTDRDHPLSSSRKWGLYRCLGYLFHNYFQLNQYRNCKSVLRALDASKKDVPAFGKFEIKDQVVWLYRVGYLSFAQEEYAKAEESLLKAWSVCPPRFQSQREYPICFLFIMVHDLSGVD